MKTAVIVAGTRTPVGSYLGCLSSMSAPMLGGIAIEGALKKGNIQPKDIEEVFMGQVLQAGSGQAPARQAAFYGGLHSKTPCTTINKVCGSGLYSVIMARQQIALGEAKIIVAGGMESMSQAPYALPKARNGFRMGHQKALDLMITDGLFDPYGQSHMGSFGDMCAREYGFSRQQQDEYAIGSYEKALRAQEEGLFADEITPVAIKIKGENNRIYKDEEPTRFNAKKIPSLKPAFDADGTITAANASKLNDGGAAVIVMDEAEAKHRNISNGYKIISSATYAQDPQWFTTAPSRAIRRAVDKANLTLNEIDLFEINEAFSVVTMAAIKDLSLNANKVNIFGGAVALGHPIGCSGTRVLVTLLNALSKKQKQYGCASLCLGGGEAVAMIVERMQE